MYLAECYGKGGIYAKMVADSISKTGIRISTLELNYHRFIHSEFMTHRMFSRNASSSRAIPVNKILEKLKENPAMPIYWGKNKAGMQADEELDVLIFTDPECSGISREDLWKDAAEMAGYFAKDFSKTGYHKQIVNRLTEPFQFIRVIVTATEWDNFFKLRLHPAAQPEIQELARSMKIAMDSSIPEKLSVGEYHLPYIDKKEFNCFNKHPKMNAWNGSIEEPIKASIARCARVSYLNHDKSKPDVKKDIELYNHLLKEGHMSPFEHIATPIDEIQMNGLLHGVHPDNWDLGTTHVDKNDVSWSGNFKGWIQYRQLL
ncbi:MAG: FAD-dependent thymidylate synthase [Saprospiraceae bacterium]|nr:FAD-dependent thymidylate synthase [Saprospiraceae bacterium]